MNVLIILLLWLPDLHTKLIKIVESPSILLSDLDKREAMINEDDAWLKTGNVRKLSKKSIMICMILLECLGKGLTKEVMESSSIR